FDGTRAASGGHGPREPAWPEDRSDHRRRIALGRYVQEVAVREIHHTKGLEQRPFGPLCGTIPPAVSVLSDVRASLDSNDRGSEASSVNWWNGADRCCEGRRSGRAQLR